MLTAFLFACAFYSPSAEASRWPQFLAETEALLTTSAHDLAELDAGLRAKHQGIYPLPPKIREVEARMKEVAGMVAKATASLDEELSAQSSCSLPSRAEISLVEARLARIEDRAKNIRDQLGELHAGMERHLDDTGLDLLSSANAALGAYLGNLGEIKAWIGTERVAGLTTELLARHPACAGKVTKSELLPAAHGNAEAEGEDGPEEAKVRIDLRLHRAGNSFSADAQ